MELGKEDSDLVCGHKDNCSCVSPELKKYSDAKLRAAEQREQALLEKPLLIEKIINKIKDRFKTR